MSPREQALVREAFTRGRIAGSAGMDAPEHERIIAEVFEHVGPNPNPSCGICCEHLDDEGNRRCRCLREAGQCQHCGTFFRAPRKHSRKLAEGARELLTYFQAARMLHTSRANLKFAVMRQIIPFVRVKTEKGSVTRLRRSDVLCLKANGAIDRLEAVILGSEAA